MKNLILTICMSLAIVNVYSQDANSPITLQKKKYYQNGVRLKPKKLKSLLTNNPRSAEEYKLARQQGNIAAPFMVAGGVCAFAAGVTMLADSKKDLDALNNGEIREGGNSGLGFAVIGLACVVISVPFAVKSSKHITKSVDQYNSSLSSSGQLPIGFEFIVNSDGLGLRMRF